MERFSSLGIPTVVYYPRPLHLQPAFVDFWSQQQGAHCPVAEQLALSVLSIPMHPYLPQEQIVRIADALTSE